MFPEHNKFDSDSAATSLTTDLGHVFSVECLVLPSFSVFSFYTRSHPMPELWMPSKFCFCFGFFVAWEPVL